jgi:hypothetical protein
VFENRVLRRKLGPKRDEVTGEWKKLHNEKLRDLYSSPSIIRGIKSKKMGGLCSTNCGEEERPRRRWLDNIGMVLEEVGWVMWIGLVWLRIGTGALVNSALNLRVLQNAGKLSSGEQLVATRVVLSSI